MGRNTLKSVLDSMSVRMCVTVYECVGLCLCQCQCVQGGEEGEAGGRPGKPPRVRFGIGVWAESDTGGGHGDLLQQPR